MYGPGEQGTVMPLSKQSNFNKKQKLKDNRDYQRNKINRTSARELEGTDAAMNDRTGGTLALDQSS